MLEGAHTAAVRHPDDHLDVIAPPRPGSVPGGVVLDLMEGLEGEAGELDLRHRLQPVDRHADGHAHDGALGQRRVDDALISELREEAVRHAEHASVDADVLAQHQDVVVALHLLHEGEVDGLDHGHLPRLSHRRLLVDRRVPSGPLPVRRLARRRDLALELLALPTQLVRRLRVDMLEPIDKVRLHPRLPPLDRLPDLGVDLDLQRGLARGVENALAL
jgi:hypothetical protein